MAHTHDPTLPAAQPTSGPFHEPEPPKSAVSRRNPKLTFAVIGGLLAILALAIGMLLSGPTFVDEEDTETPRTFQVKAGR